MNERTPTTLPKESSEGDVHTYTSNEGKVYDVYRLNRMAEALPVENIALSDLAKFLEEKCWSDPETGMALSPHDVVAALFETPGLDFREAARRRPELAWHINKLLTEDYEHNPILVLGKDEIVDVVDGMHRLTKASLEYSTEGVQDGSISARRFASLASRGDLCRCSDVMMDYSLSVKIKKAATLRGVSVVKRENRKAFFYADKE